MNWLYNSACALAIAAQALGEKQPDLAAGCAAEAADLLRRSVAAGNTNFAAIQSDLDLEAIRDRDEFRQVLAQGQLDRSLAGLWETDPAQESAPLIGLEPGLPRARCQELAATGFRPVTISVDSQSKFDDPKSPIVTASVWRRPVIPDAARDALARRQANAAAALLRMGTGDEVWPLLKHSPDPRVRSYLIHALAPLGCDSRAIVRRIEEEADTSVRRALVLALGEFSDEQFPIAQRAPLIEPLLSICESDPDAGLRAAGEWLLRQWGQGEQVKALSNKHRMNDTQRQAAQPRQWYVNTQGQTFVIFQPDEFLMGSPASEPDHDPNEGQHGRRLPRRFAMAAQEVTHSEYAAFQATHPETQVVDIDKYVKTDDSPQIAMSWYEAAAYCNWLSEQEGIPQDQWCYEPNPQGKYSKGMRANCRLLGYRLPSEAEWEYACRAGAVTSRYYGSSEGLLGKYAWYLQNGIHRTWPVGSLKPNEAGLFDPTFR